MFSRQVDDCIYKSISEALSYVVLVSLSFIVPSLIEIWDSDTKFYLTIFINAAIIFREYALLFRNKDVPRTYWMKRLIGIAAETVAGLYGLVLMLIYATQDCIPSWVIIFNVLILLMACIPMSFSVEECVYYIKSDYHDRYNDHIDYGPKVVNKHTKRV